MRRKVEKYLNSKEKNEYSNLDKIFDLYLSGDIKKFLSEYTDVAIHPAVNESGKTIQLEYNYNNIYAIIDFFEDRYSVVVYHAGVETYDLNKLFVDFNYQEDFSLEKLINEVDEKIKKHPKLKDTTSKEKKKKIYSLIAWISLWLPIVICGGIGLYCVITESTLKANSLGVLFFIVPLIVWFVFDVKSNKLK